MCAEPQRVKARLKWFNAAKGFGFVIPEDNPVDAFLHITQLQKMGIYGLGEGAELLCVVEYGQKGASVLEVVQIISLGKCQDDEVSYDPGNAALHAVKGMVKLYHQDKGYGFILPNDGMKDIFVHKSCLEKCGIEELESGMPVRVVYKIAEKGREAVEITLEGTLEGGL